jgi:hypothetical protein
MSERLAGRLIDREADMKTGSQKGCQEKWMSERLAGRLVVMEADRKTGSQRGWQEDW